MGEALPFTVRPMSDDEMEQYGWPDYMDPPSVIETKDNRVFVPARDPELNGPGHLTELQDGDIYSLQPG